MGIGRLDLQNQSRLRVHLSNEDQQSGSWVLFHKWGNYSIHDFEQLYNDNDPRLVLLLRMILMVIDTTTPAIYVN